MKTFSTNQGALLTERQQKLILALEVVNRLEVSLAAMQKSKLDLTERQSKVRASLAQIADDLLPQSVDRYVSMRGLLDTEGVRESRRQVLMKEQRELSILSQQIDRELFTLNEEIRRTELQLRTIRNQVFGEIDRQLSDL
jgi:predicted  nucleic acid-binding Zn-ribbon protein